MAGSDKSQTGQAESRPSRVRLEVPQRHWLVRPGAILGLCVGGVGILAICVLLEFAIPGYVHFGVDGIFGFYAWYGFGTCVLMVLGAKLLGLFLKRRDNYYDD